MNDKQDLILQTRNAFGFVQKFYLEVSFLIKELEGMFADKEFTLLRPSGYGVSMRSSTGLEANNVKHWLPRSLSVAFAVETEMDRGVTSTKITDDLKVILVRVIVIDDDIEQPQVVSCVGYNIEVKPAGVKYFKKFENTLAHFEYHGLKTFVKKDSTKYEDSYIAFNAKTITCNLFDLTDSDAVQKMIVKPTLDLYNNIKA